MFVLVFMWQLEVLAILKEGRKNFHSLKVGHKKSYPVLRGGGVKVSNQRFFAFCTPASLQLMTIP